ncbi:MAG: HDOD domain-containing protein [Halioglobus sp.]|nr:HDOD domain-containing protein [Halioglobus sp.]
MNTELANSLEQAIESGDLELPVLPAVAARVMELTRDPDSSAADLAALVQSDQTLAGYIMRVANSAAYAARDQMQTLQQAITRLGMQQIGQMALTMIVGEVLLKLDKRGEAIVSGLWRTSLGTAAWSREIARMMRENTETAFLCGLLHEIGKPVALHTIIALAREQDTDLEEDELVELMNRYHQVIGARLATEWRLPDPVIETINHIDDHLAAPTSAQSVAIVRGAREINAALEADPDTPIESIESDMLIELNLYEEDRRELDGKKETVQELLQAMVV